MTRWLLLLALAGCSREPAESVPLTRMDQPLAAKKSPPPRPAALTQVTIKALGMYCEESCPVKVRYALADVPAVYELGFNLSTESVFVSYDATLGDAKKVTAPMLVAIRGAGFNPWLAKESWPSGAKTDVVVR